MKGFNINKLTERQKIAHSFFESVREELEQKESCNSCEQAGYVYVDYKGDFTQYCSFLNELADEIEKASGILKNIRLKEMEEALQDPNLRENLDLFVNMPTDFKTKLFKSGNSLAIVIPKRKCEDIRAKDKDEVAVVLRKMKEVKL